MFHRKFIYTWFEQTSQKKLARKTKANRSKIRTSSVPRTVSNSIFLFISLYFFRSNFDNLNSICLALLWKKRQSQHFQQCLSSIAWMIPDSTYVPLNKYSTSHIFTFFTEFFFLFFFFYYFFIWGWLSPMTMSFPSRRGQRRWEFPGAMHTSWMGSWRHKDWTTWMKKKTVGVILKKKCAVGKQLFTEVTASHQTSIFSLDDINCFSIKEGRTVSFFPLDWCIYLQER